MGDGWWAARVADGRWKLEGRERPKTTLVVELVEEEEEVGSGEWRGRWKWNEVVPCADQSGSDGSD